MIVGGHITIASGNEAADQAFFRDILKLPNVDAGGGYIIFRLPPCEVAMHDGDGTHTLHLMCEDMDEFVAAMSEIGVATTEPSAQSWGIMTNVTLPGGGALHVYQPAHKHPPQPAARMRKAAPKVKKNAAKKKALARPTKKKKKVRKAR